MQALVLDGTPRVILDAPRPPRPPGEALIAMRMAGVCDTDLQLARGYMGFRGVLGHELVGEVIEADDRAWLGRRVVADINAGCGACPDCRDHRGHHCPTRTVLGILGRGGAMAELVAVPERCLVAVPADLADELAVFAEPLAAALHVLDALGPGDDRAIVLGDGKLGLLIAMVLAEAGVATTVVGHHRAKLARVAGVVGLLEDELAADLRAPVVVEATGSAAGLARALRLCAPRGRLVLKSTIAAAHTVDLSPVVIHELTVIGSRCGDLARAIDVLARGRLDPRPLVDARFPLAEADRALARAGERGVLKVLIDR